MNISGTPLYFGDYAILIWNFIASMILDISWRTYFSKPPSAYVPLEEEEDVSFI